MLKIIYRCSQSDLYEVARVGWNECSSRLSDFTAFKSLYTTTYVTARLTEIDTAEGMSDSTQRTEDSRLTRIKLKDKATEALNSWQILKRYIVQAYLSSDNLLSIKLDVAGQKYYQKATNNDWGATLSLLNAGDTFIT